MNTPPGRSAQLDRRTGRSVFGADAHGYHGSRSGYPEALFAYLQGRVAAAPRILEVGAGTGFASEGLLTFAPAHFTLIEPDPRLCDVLERRFGEDRVTVRQGTFPEVRIEGPFDLVTCAAAFHWMEPRPALARIQEILAPGGIWAMWWNCYLGHGEVDPLATRAMEILEDERVALPPSFLAAGHYSLDTVGLTALLDEAGFREIEHRLYRSRRMLDPNQARKLYESFSFIKVLEPAHRERILDLIAEFVRKDLDGIAASVVVTSLFAATH
ncbi:MAG: class I SAM-dependent methyltransferase [Sphingomonadales bacterium]|nr:class I SAM-dependent methyltransferase [Sphingomonadales bacterium]MDE2568391.1 class I SAM-dependent methyltransferase [Sphingomonadales bacterium]